MPRRAKASEIKPGSRNNVTIELSGPARALIYAEVERTGMPKTVLAERVFTWFAQQDEVVRGVILGTVPASVAPDVAKLVLERTAGKK